MDEEEEEENETEIYGMRCVREKETAPALICHSRLSSSSLASCEHGMLRASRYVFLLGFSFIFFSSSFAIIAHHP